MIAIRLPERKIKVMGDIIINFSTYGIPVIPYPVIMDGVTCGCRTRGEKDCIISISS
jgi:hypothetical protein